MYNGEDVPPPSPARLFQEPNIPDSFEDYHFSLTGQPLDSEDESDEDEEQHDPSTMYDDEFVEKEPEFVSYHEQFYPPPRPSDFKWDFFANQYYGGDPGAGSSSAAAVDGPSWSGW